MYEVKISEKIDLILESKLDDVPIRLSIQIVLPYVNPMSRLKEHTTKDGKKYLFMWNGFSVSLPVDEKDFEMQNRFNTIPEEIRMVDIVLQKRVSIMKYLDIQ